MSIFKQRFNERIREN